MMKQDSVIPTTVCGNCGAEERRLLHYVRHRGIFRRLCTSCVLRLHPQSFCPACFLVHDRSPLPSNDTVSCFKCYSQSHAHCVGANAANPYICPLCVNPSVPIFTTKKVKNGEGEGGDGNCREIDKKAAKVLLVAAWIAADTMSKAGENARLEAEKRAKEAAVTRKRAREALEHVAFLVAKENLKRKESPAVVSGAGNTVVQGRNHKVGSANSVGVVNALAVAEQGRIGSQRRLDRADGPNEEQGRIGSQRRLDRADGPNEVSARLNAVGLRDNDRSEEFNGQSVVSGLQSNRAAMSVEGDERLKSSTAAANVEGGRFAQNNENERPKNLGQLENNSVQGEKTTNGLYSVPPVGDELQRMQSNSGREENLGSQQ